MVTVSSRLPYVVDTQLLRDTVITNKMKLQYQFARPMKKPGLELRRLQCKSRARSTEAQTSSKAAVNTSGRRTAKMCRWKHTKNGIKHT